MYWISQQVQTLISVFDVGGAVQRMTEESLAKTTTTKNIQPVESFIILRAVVSVSRLYPPGCVCCCRMFSAVGSVQHVWASKSAWGSSWQPHKGHAPQSPFWPLQSVCLCVCMFVRWRARAGQHLCSKVVIFILFKMSKFRPLLVSSGLEQNIFNVMLNVLVTTL